MKSSASQITSKHRLISIKHMPFLKLSFQLHIISSLPVLHSTHCRLPLRAHCDSIYCLSQSAVISVLGTCELRYSNGLCIFIFLIICVLLFHDILPELSLIRTISLYSNHASVIIPYGPILFFPISV